MIGQLYFINLGQILIVDMSCLPFCQEKTTCYQSMSASAS